MIFLCKWVDFYVPCLFFWGRNLKSTMNLPQTRLMTTNHVDWQSERIRIRPTNNPLRLIETVETVEPWALNLSCKNSSSLYQKNISSIKQLGWRNYPEHSGQFSFPDWLKRWWVPDCRINHLNLNKRPRKLYATQIVDKIWTGKNIQSSWNWGYTISVYTS